jgi:hypothetical protein
VATKILKSLNRTAAMKIRKRRSDTLPHDCQIVGRGLLMGVNLTAWIDLARKSAAGVNPLSLCRNALPPPSNPPRAGAESVSFPLLCLLTMTCPTTFHHMALEDCRELGTVLTKKVTHSTAVVTR